MGTQIHQKISTICNYMLIGSASSCIFLTLSLRLVPTVVGLLLIILHVATIAGAACGSAVAPGGKWYAAHMAGTASAAVFQGMVTVLVFATTGDFLVAVGSYVREEDGEVIVRMCGGLCGVMFCLEWAVLWFGFVGRFSGDDQSCGKGDEELKNWPWQV